MASPIHPASLGRTDLQVVIQKERSAVWRALIADIQAWWLPTFHLLGAESQMVLETEAGGRGLYESHANGSGLQWYSVQCILPQDFKLYLVGHLAEEWGGPTCSYLTLALEADAAGHCVLHVHDSHVGRVSDASLNSAQAGWQELFGDGLKPYVEAS